MSGDSVNEGPLECIPTMLESDMPAQFLPLVVWVVAARHGAWTLGYAHAGPMHREMKRGDER